ncbi:DUF3231 family protein [Bacillus sp. HNG]|uniref:DUF3231 family protein n=1 Tax=Bacillus sp. HNG TaxID=2293325 RepID=UPI000E2F656E|nr:DUF3231 family protein [Bacillus sp. HNG]RFB14816.1 DUF3231 family protein [Bacillus sp. HNG]
MTNPLESVLSIIKNFVDDEPKPPLHVGEVMDLWTAYTAFNEAHILYQVGLNSTTDTDLIHALQSAFHSSEADTKKIESFLIKEGVPLPPLNSPKPVSNPGSVPEGVRLTDDELANLISVKIATSITFCAQAMSKTIRTDVGLLFFEIQINLMRYAAPFKNMMKKRGWLKIPPKYHPPGLPEK